MSLDEKLNKIRSPNLESQKHTALVLSSIDETLRSQNTNPTATAYFAALLALLKQSTAAIKVSPSSEVVLSTVYLLDLVTSHVPTALLRAQFSNILSVLTPLLAQSELPAPLVRSSIGCLESLLLAQDSQAWALPQNQNGPRQAILALLAYAIDSRPKIRKRAQEALINILSHPPPGPAIDHPAAELCAVSTLHNLKTTVDSVSQVKRHKGRPDDSHDPAVIHALQLTKTIAAASRGWPSKKIEPLCELLLSISRSRNEYLVMSAFEVFEVIFESIQDEVSSSKLPRLLEAITELKPAQNDSQLLPPWIAVLSRGYGAAAEIEANDTFLKLPGLFDLISPYLTSPSHNIRVSASECLISFCANCVPDGTITDPSVYDEKVFQQVADRANSLLVVKYQTAWMEVFNILSALFDAFRWRGDPYLLVIVKAVGHLRSNEAFQGKKEADVVLGHAIRNLGPQAVLTVLPHNLTKPRAGQPGRAWLLPLLRDHVSNTNLAHFKSELVPVSESMYQRVIEHGSAEKTLEIKIFETVVQQVWATLPGYCDLPLDLRTSMDQTFAELLSNLLYQQTDLRVDVCRGLQNLVESNKAIIEAEDSDNKLQLERRTTHAEAQKNVEHLASLANNLLAVLFNVYSQTLPQSRAYILQCINAYLSITPEKDLVETFQRVSKMLEGSLPTNAQSLVSKAAPMPKDKLPPTSHTLLDLVIALSIYLPRSTFGSLFALAANILNNTSVSKSDPQLVKKAYKLLPRLATSAVGLEALNSRNAELQALILTTADQTPVPARRDRLLAVHTVLSTLPLCDLHFIPSILSEVVLACKDTNDKARTAAFDLLIAVAKKISSTENPAGTVIRNSKVPHMPDDAPDALASLDEVFTMVSAGLAGVAPHMVAATITALSRLLFEFHSSVQLTKATLDGLVDTVCLFIRSNNREIVRAVLGFVKVMVVVLDTGMLEARMETFVPGMMVWGHENKGRLRAKVKGILERCVRRFGGSTVEGWVGEKGRKMVVNIRKKRERSKRKNKEAGIGDDDSDDNKVRKVYDNEFDEAVYGSDEDGSEIVGSDDDDDDDDDEVMSNAISFKSKGKKRSKGQDQFIRQDEDDDEPLDLLDPSSAGHISSRKFTKSTQQKVGTRTKARTNEDGKLVFGKDDDDDMLMSELSGARVDEGDDGSAVNAYVDAVDGPDAVRRGQKGRLKVKSGMQKSARAARGEKMELDLDEAREVAQSIMRGSASPRTAGRPSLNQKQQRRGLGVEKNRSSTGQQAGKQRSGPARGRVGKRVSFGAGRRR